MNDQPEIAEDVPAGAAEEDVVQNSADVDESIESLREEAARNFAGWQRAQADYENLKRRSAEDVRNRVQDSQKSILRDLLDLADDFERANREAPIADDTDDPWQLGVVMISQKLNALLAKQQVQQIQTEGQPFDPDFHEAVGQLPGQHGEIVAVLRTGYTIGPRVLRASQVMVGDGSIPSEAPDESNTEPANETAPD